MGGLLVGGNKFALVLARVVLDVPAAAPLILMCLTMQACTASVFSASRVVDPENSLQILAVPESEPALADES